MGKTNFLQPVAFATCSYLKRRPGARKAMVLRALSSWGDLLDLPFAEKIFLDDRSPDLGALRLLASTHLLEKFTRVEYCSVAHPAHCNFGYVGAVQLAASPYILHLDDDVSVTGSQQECAQWIDLAIRVMEEEPELLERLWANTRFFKAELARLGFDTGASETPITPVIVGDSAAAIEFADRLFAEGVFAPSVVYPTVALDRARIRTIVTAAHTDAHLERCVAAFFRVGRSMGVIRG